MSCRTSRCCPPASGSHMRRVRARTGGVRSPSAANQLGLRCGLLPAAHAPNHPLSEAESHICLDRHESETVVGKLPHTPRSHEAATIIFTRLWIDYSCTDDVSLAKP